MSEKLTTDLAQSSKLTTGLVQSNKQTWANSLDSNQYRYVEEPKSERALGINTTAIRVLFEMVQDLCERIEKLEAPNA